MTTENPIATEDKVRQIIQELTQQSLDGTASDEDLLEVLGLDSLAGLKMLATLEKKCLVVFPNERLAELRTLSAITNEIENAS